MWPNVLPLFAKAKSVSKNWCVYHRFFEVYPLLTAQVHCRGCGSCRGRESRGRRLLRDRGRGGERDRPALRWVPWAGSKESRRGQGKVQGNALVVACTNFGGLGLGCIDANFASSHSTCQVFKLSKICLTSAPVETENVHKMLTMNLFDDTLIKFYQQSVVRCHKSCKIQIQFVWNLRTPGHQKLLHVCETSANLTSAEIQNFPSDFSEPCWILQNVAKRFGIVCQGKKVFQTIGASTILSPELPLYFQPRYSVADATAAGVTNLQAAGFSVTDALAASVTDLRSAGYPGLEVRNPGEIKVRYKVGRLFQLWMAHSRLYRFQFCKLTFFKFAGFSSSLRFV